MNYELTLGRSVTQRKHHHLWGANVSTLPLLLNIHKQDQQIVISLLCYIATQSWAKPSKRWVRPKHLLLPDASVSLLLCRLCLSVIKNDVSTSPTPFFRDGSNAAGVYPVIQLSRGLVLTALLLITELGERATPTHWLIGSSAQHAGTLLVKMWRTDADSVAFLQQIHSHILLIYRLPWIWYKLYWHWPLSDPPSTLYTLFLFVLKLNIIMLCNNCSALMCKYTTNSIFSL